MSRSTIAERVVMIALMLGAMLAIMLLVPWFVKWWGNPMDWLFRYWDWVRVSK